MFGLPARNLQVCSLGARTNPGSLDLCGIDRPVIALGRLRLGVFAVKPGDYGENSEN
jgi:hypothetical protein